MSKLEAFIENTTYDELAVGASATHVRTLTLQDIQAFALVSGDVNPAHLDPEYAEGTQFHGVIGHGMWGAALISRVLGVEFPGPGTIYLEQSLRFRRPVRVGDTLTVSVKVASKCDDKKHVTLDCTVTNQKDAVVLSGQAVVLAPTEKVVRAAMPLPTMHLFDPQARLAAFVASLKDHPPVPCAVVHPCDGTSLRGAIDAAREGLIVPWLVGPAGRILAIAAEEGIDLSLARIDDVPHSHAAAARAAELAADGSVQMLMKGSLHTDELMHAVIAQRALATGTRLSHAWRFEIPTYPKPVLITDAAINIEPSLDDKVAIVRNAIAVAQALGVAKPKVAILSAVETVTPKIASTLHAAALCKMADRGQIAGAVLDGPLAFDNAISRDAARIKGIASPVAGDADVLVVPDLESGNMLAKQLEYLAGAASCGVVVGARVPIALTSRADGADSRLASAALAALIAVRNAAARASLANKG